MSRERVGIHPDEIIGGDPRLGRIVEMLGLGEEEEELTALAKIAQAICPLEGEEYLRSEFRRGFHRYTACCLAVFCIPPAYAAGMIIAKGKEDDVFYDRLVLDGKLEEFKIRKVRSLSEPDEEGNQAPLGFLARLLRTLGLDEAYQFLQVFESLGEKDGSEPGMKMWLVGPRVIAPEDKNLIEAVALPELIQQFVETYESSGPAIINLNSITKNRKACSADPATITPEEVEAIVLRMERDIFSVQNASFLLDLLVLGGTLDYLAEQVANQVEGLVQKQIIDRIPRVNLTDSL